MQASRLRYEATVYRNHWPLEPSRLLLPDTEESGTMLTYMKRIAVLALLILIFSEATTSPAPARPVRMGISMPPAAINFRFVNRPVSPFTGFSTNPLIGLTTSSSPAQRALALQLANQLSLQGTNPILSQQLLTALRTNPFLAQDLLRTNPALARQLMNTDQNLFRELRQINPALARDLNAILRTNPNLLNQPLLSPLTSASGYPNSLSSYGNLYGSSTIGSADIMNAQSQMMISNQQALMVHESVLKSKLEQRRRVFDEWLYERANTPSLEDIREREQELIARRSRNDPPFPEIQSAVALNSLLAELQKVEAKGTTISPVSLEDGLLKNINVTATQDGANFGALRNEGLLNWPPALRDLTPSQETQGLRKEMDTLVKAALDQAKTGKVQTGILAQLQSDVQNYREFLKRNTGELTPPQYIQARRFLDELDASVKVLERDDAANYVLGKFAPKGATVRDLVRHMSNLGLIFAPATAGDEAAYVALQRALAEASQRAQVQTASER